MEQELAGGENSWSLRQYNYNIIYIHGTPRGDNQTRRRTYRHSRIHGSMFAAEGGSEIDVNNIVMEAACMG